MAVKRARALLIVYILAFCQPSWADCSALLRAFTSLIPGYQERVAENEYIATEYQDREGVKPVAGLTSLLGSEVIAEFTPQGGRTAIYRGRVLQEYEAGLELLDERTGQVHVCNTNRGKFGKIRVKPNPIQWAKAHDLRTVRSAHQAQKDPMILIELYDTDGDVSYFLYGRLKHKGGTIYTVTDRKGTEHAFDAFRTYFHAEITERDTNTVNLFTRLKLHTPAVNFVPQKAAADPQKKEQAEVQLKDFINKGKQLTSSMTFEQDFQPPAKFTDEQATRLAKNMELMGIKKVDYSGEQFGDSKTWPIAFYYGITVKKNVPAVRELAQILLHEHKDSAALKAELNAWAQRHNTGYQFAFKDDVKRLGKIYRDLGWAEQSGTIIGENGFIMHSVYTRMIADGILPLADPHDALSHLASLPDRHFREPFRKFSALIWDTYKALDFPYHSELRDIDQLQDERLSAYAAIEDLLTGTVRDMNHENWTYLTPKNELFMQGNCTFNALFNGLIRRRRFEFLDNLINCAKLSDTLGTEELNKLPRLQEFLQQRGPEAMTAYQAFHLELWRQGMSRARLPGLQKKLEEFSKEYFTHPGPASMDEVHQFMRELGRFLAADPDFRYIFSRAGRKHSFDTAVFFFSLYKEWVDSWPPTSNPQPEP